MEIEAVTETSDINSILTWVIARKGFIACSYRERFKS
jgi:hypothetical protein